MEDKIFFRLKGIVVADVKIKYKKNKSHQILEKYT